MDEQKIAVKRKHKTPKPWDDVADKYPIGSRHPSKVVKVKRASILVELPTGIVGLVQLKDMSWTKRIKHPSELVSIGDQIEVQVLNINNEKQQISLGMKQVQPNPWDKVAQRYPPGAIVSGVVHNLTDYGAFIEIEEGVIGLLHVNEMSWVHKVVHPSEIVNKGDKVTCVVLNVAQDHEDRERKRIDLGLKQMSLDPWISDIPSRYRPGEIKKGKVRKLINFGVFVELEPGLEGLLHISELSNSKLESPEKVVQLGAELEVKILRVDVVERKIALSLRAIGFPNPLSEAVNPPRRGRRVAAAIRRVDGSGIEAELDGGGMGQVNRNEVAWEVSVRPQDVAVVGERREFVLLKRIAQSDRARVWEMSLRLATPCPWDWNQVASQCKPGAVIQSTLRHLDPERKKAQVELEGGGLATFSLEVNRYVLPQPELLTLGVEVKVVIEAVSVEGRSITARLLRAAIPGCESYDWEELRNRFPEERVVVGTIRKFDQDRCWAEVDLEEGGSGRLSMLQCAKGKLPLDRLGRGSLVEMYVMQHATRQRELILYPLRILGSVSSCPTD